MFDFTCQKARPFIRSLLVIKSLQRTKPVARYYLREHLFGDLSKRMVPINGSVNFVGRSVNYLFNRYLYCVNKGLIFLASANHHDDPMMVPGRP